jgi:hypothetical protein
MLLYYSVRGVPVGADRMLQKVWEFLSAGRLWESLQDYCKAVPVCIHYPPLCNLPNTSSTSTCPQ